MTDQSDSSHGGSMARRPFGYRPAPVQTAEGHVLAELHKMYADGEIDLDTIARILPKPGDPDRSGDEVRGAVLNVLDTAHAQGDMDDATHRRLRDAVEQVDSEA